MYNDEANTTSLELGRSFQGGTMAPYLHGFYSPTGPK